MEKMKPHEVQIINGEVPTQQALVSLRSAQCPACGNAKQSEQSVCFSCWGSLPKLTRLRLYDRIGEGYEKALANALIKLKELKEQSR